MSRSAPRGMSLADDSAISMSLLRESLSVSNTAVAQMPESTADYWCRTQVAQESLAAHLMLLTLNTLNPTHD